MITTSRLTTLKASLCRLLIVGAALSGIWIYSASATLTFDLRAKLLKGAAFADPKNVVVAPGDNVTLELFAVVSATTTTGTNAFQELIGSVLSTINSVTGNLGSPALEAPFNAAGSAGIHW